MRELAANTNEHARISKLRPRRASTKRGATMGPNTRAGRDAFVSSLGLLGAQVRWTSVQTKEQWSANLVIASWGTLPFTQFPATLLYCATVPWLFHGVNVTKDGWVRLELGVGKNEDRLNCHLSLNRVFGVRPYSSSVSLNKIRFNRSAISKSMSDQMFYVLFCTATT